MTNREKMKAALVAAAAAKGKPPPPAAAATVPKRKKPSRSAPARDARAWARGRLPRETHVSAVWTGKMWAGSLTAYGADGVAVFRVSMARDGQFRLMEEMDVLFWEWFASPEAVSEGKDRLVFAPDPQPPEKT